MQHSKNLMFTKGDLIHIPQSVILYGLSGAGAKIYVNKKPTLAIFLDYRPDNMSEVVVDGQKWLVKNREIYLNEGVGNDVN